MKPSQEISTLEIDDAYDKLHTEKDDLQERLDGVELAVNAANNTIDSLQQENQRLEAEIEKLKELVDIKNAELVEVVPEARRLREALETIANGYLPGVCLVMQRATMQETAEKALQGDKD